MDPINRRNSLLYPNVVRGCIRIDPVLSREDQFNQWIAGLTPYHCQRHKRTRSVLNHDDSRRASFTENDAAVWYERFTNPATTHVPGPHEHEKFYPFEARFHCRACKVEYAQVPPEFCESSFEEFEPRTAELDAALTRCREFVTQVNAHGCGFALLCGYTGNGKTRLACNVIREVNTNDCLYITQARAVIQHRATYGQRHHYMHKGGSYEDDDAQEPPKTIWSVASKVGLLVLDEIGATALAPDELLMLDEMLKHRHAHWKPTILISNLALTGPPERPGMKEFLGDAPTDRIAEATGNGKFILQFSGESYRRSVGENYLNRLR